MHRSVLNTPVNGQFGMPFNVLLVASVNTLVLPWINVVVTASAISPLISWLIPAACT